LQISAFAASAGGGAYKLDPDSKAIYGSFDLDIILRTHEKKKNCPG